MLTTKLLKNNLYSLDNYVAFHNSAKNRVTKYSQNFEELSNNIWDNTIKRQNNKNKENS